jgi:hypothetical protein
MWDGHEEGHGSRVFYTNPVTHKKQLASSKMESRIRGNMLPWGTRRSACPVNSLRPIFPFWARRQGYESRPPMAGRYLKRYIYLYNAFLDPISLTQSLHFMARVPIVDQDY